MKIIKLTKNFGIIFLLLFACFSHNSNEFTKSFKVNFLKFCLLFVAVIVFINIGFAQENGGPYTTDDNTVLLMHFEDNVENSADVGVNGILHGSGISYETSVNGHGNCIRLDNSSWDKQSWIEVPFYDELNCTDGISVECWFKINSWGESSGGTRYLFRKDGQSWAADYEIILWPEPNEGRNGQVNLECEDDEMQNWGADAPIADLLELDTWYYIVMYYSFSQKHMCCLIRDENFEEIFASRGYSATPPTNSNGLFKIGFGGGSDSYFDGWIDELRISNIYRKYRDDVLADVDINSLKDSVFIPLKDNWTVYQWPLAEYYPISNETGEIFRKNACGPTMLTRGIHFWEYPRFPSGVIEHEMQDCQWYANYDETEYLWDQMPPVFSVGVTEEEYAPATLLSAQVGVASRKTYDNMYCMPKFLKENFLFSKRTRLVFEEEYTKEEWENIIKSELNSGRIVLVGGWGHYYIINGYNSKNEFFTDYSFNDNYWNDIKEFVYGDMQDMIIYMEPDWGNKELELVYPQSNDIFQQSTNIEIQWNSENITQLIIEYSSDAGYTWKTISEEVDATFNSYSWTIPEDISDNYRIRISDMDNLNVYRKIMGIEVFEQKAFTFNYPMSDAKFLKNTEQTIYWQSTGLKAFKLEYSTDNTNWYILSDSVNAQNENCQVQFPDIVTENISMKATELNESENTYSSEVFQLVAEPLWGGPYMSDEETELLMHFENDLSNSANSQLLPHELNPIGVYSDNYNNNLGKAFRVFNGDIVGDAIHIKNSENIDLGNDWTMEAWVNVSSIMGKRSVGALIINKWEAFEINAGVQHFGASVNFENNTFVNFYCPNTYQLEKWYHVAMISDASSEQIYFYIHDENQNLIYKQEKSFPAGSNGIIKSNDNLLTIGGLGGASNLELDGYLDELRISKTSYQSDYFEYAEIPFYDDFENEYENWSSRNIAGADVWHISGDDGIDLSKCARFYITSNPQKANDDWLLTPLFNTNGINNLQISFKYLYHGDGIIPEFYYANSYDGNLSNSTWTQIDNNFWQNMGTWNDALIEIENPGNPFVFAIRYQSTVDIDYYILIDDFRVEGTTTNTEERNLSINDFKIYPNPILKESIISFTNSTSGKVNLSIFDLQGRKICTVLNKNIPQGKHTVSLGNQIKENGIYFCTLTTETERRTLKLIVNK